MRAWIRRWIGLVSSRVSAPGRGVLRRGAGREAAGSGAAAGSSAVGSGAVGSSAAVAVVVARVAALLRGGLPVARVFAVLVHEFPGQPFVREVAQRLGEGESPGEALARCDEPEWRVLAAAWHLADQSGAPLSAALDRIASALRDIEQLRERRTVLLAGPRTTVRMVCALPPLSLLLGGLLGFNPLPVLLSPVGAALCVLGLLLLGGGIAWARSLQRAAEASDRVAGLELELAWIVLAGGAPTEHVRRRIVDCVDALRVTWIEFDRLCDSEPLCSLVRSAQASGVPLGPVLLEEARACRMRAGAELERSAERLGVRVLVPLGVCVLPSFIVLGVVPVVMTMLTGVRA